MNPVTRLASGPNRPRHGQGPTTLGSPPSGRFSSCNASQEALCSIWRSRIQAIALMSGQSFTFGSLTFDANEMGWLYTNPSPTPSEPSSWKHSSSPSTAAVTSAYEPRHFVGIGSRFRACSKAHNHSFQCLLPLPQC